MKTLHTLTQAVRSLVGIVSCWLLIVAASGLLAVEAESTEVKPGSPEQVSGSNDTLRAYLQLQEQLHATQLALERNRKESEDLALRNAQAVAALEKVLSSQRVQELDAIQSANKALKDANDAMQSTSRLILTVVGSLAVVGFAVMLLTAYLQWRAVNRLTEISPLSPTAGRAPLAHLEAGSAQMLGAGATEQSGQRLFGALTQLEKRILELEHTTHPVAPEKSSTSTGTNGSDTTNGAGVDEAEKDHATLLLAKAQSLLDMDKAGEALEAINEILTHEPDHPEALVKKGIALEQLRQVDEALRCYDQAIAANEGLTIAYLQKGGLFNRLERYEEALQCYEQALKAQERAHHH